MKLFTFLAAFGPQLFYDLAPINTQRKALQLIRESQL